MTAETAKEPCSVHIVELPFGLYEYPADLVQGSWCKNSQCTQKRPGLFTEINRKDLEGTGGW